MYFELDNTKVEAIESVQHKFFPFFILERKLYKIFCCVFKMILYLKYW